MKHWAINIILLFSTLAATAQVPTATHIHILKAEDARRYDKTLEDLLRSPNADVRERAALAAGRIGREDAIPTLAALLMDDRSEKVRAMAAFALGEIESSKGADVIIGAFRRSSGTELPNENDAGMKPASVVARLIEAAGKIAAANAKDPKAKELGRIILDTLMAQHDRGVARDREIVRLGLTAALRANMEGTDLIARKFLKDVDARIRADAANTLARVRAKDAYDELGMMLSFDEDPIARANAARAFGAGEYKEAHTRLSVAVAIDKDPRVRVAAIRSLPALKLTPFANARIAERLIEHGNKLMEIVKKSKGTAPAEVNELLEIATALGRLVPDAKHEQALAFLSEFVSDRRLISPESQIALAAINPKSFAEHVAPNGLGYANPKYAASYAQGLATLASSKDESVVKVARENLRNYIAGMAQGVKPADQRKFLMAMPELMRALAAFKPDNLDEILRSSLANDDPFLRAAAAELIAEQPRSTPNLDALKAAFSRSLVSDKRDNDAQLAMLDALFKLDKTESVGVLLTALNAPDYLVRRKAFDLLADKDLQKDLPGVPTSLEKARKNRRDQVLSYSPVSGTKLGQVLNTDADYRRALARKNGSVKAVLKSEKGTFTINFYPEEAPLAVDNFIKLARSKYFNGLEVHRVVPNFVMQDGDPRGDGNGGPGWSIRCEVNMLPYDRGAVGMALSGKDTGGSQWFVTHSPQPHLDGGYTVFGYVNETDMKVVDSIVRGDKILSVTIVGR